MALKSASVALSLLCVAAATATPSASQPRGWLQPRSLTTTELRERFQQEYGSVSEAKLEHIQRSLAPMYATLPKNSEGRLGHAAAAYALRRHFLRTYGWIVKGLAPKSGGNSWNWKSSVPFMALDGRASISLLKVLDNSLRGHGLDLEALAIVAAMLEGVLVEDSEVYLKEVFRLAEVSVSRMITDAEMRYAMEDFMLIYITTGGKKNIGRSPQRFRRFRKKCENSTKFSPLWQETKVWLRDVELSAAYARRATDNVFLHGALSFQSVGHLVADIHSQYGLIQNRECLGMKHQLLSMEDSRGTGRLSFTKFQNSSSWGAKWEFKESREDLMALGALDVSDPEWPRVIVANYVQSPANCLATHGLHSVCCIDECEALLAEVERGVGAPTGDPAEIARIVGRLESETMDAPRNVSAVLLGRLQDMAARHDGLVPLHGRLFAQWMHHAFPNECAHPLPSHWSPPETVVRNQGAGESPKELLQELDQGAVSSKGDLPAEELMPWSDEEELIEEGLGQGCYFLWILRLALLFAFLSMAVGTLRSGLVVIRRKEEAKEHKQNI